MTFGEDDFLAKYLLHRLSEQERECIRERLFSEPELFDRLREVETDLIDSLAAGRLGDDDAAAVTAFLAATGQGERLEFARALARHAHPQTPAAPRAALSFWMAVAAAVALAVCSALLFIANRRLSAELQRAHSQPLHRPASVLAFDLLPVTRGGGSVQALSVPSDVALVNIRIAAEPGFAHFLVSLKKGDGNIWSEEMPAQQTLQFLVPAAILQPGRCDVAVEGERQDGSHELIADTDIDITH